MRGTWRHKSTLDVEQNPWIYYLFYRLEYILNTTGKCQGIFNVPDWSYNFVSA